MGDFMEGDVKLPVAGKVKKRYVLVPAGLALAYVTYRWYQSNQAAKDAPAASDGTYTSDLTDMGLSTTGGATNVTGNNGSTVTDGTSPNAIDTNSEWTNEAVQLLGNAGYDSATVYAALGEFLARRALDKTEASIARAAIAAAGQPPVGGPFSVLEEAGTSTGTLAAPTNVRAWNGVTATRVGLQWDAVHGASHYRIYRTDQGDEPMGDSLDTKFNVNGLQPNTSHSYYVRALSTTGKLGGKSNTITLKTAGIKLTKPTGLKASAITKTSFRVTCGKVAGAQYYRWYVNGKPSGASDQPYRDFTGLHANTTYRITVAADTTNQTPGPGSAALSVKTKK